MKQHRVLLLRPTQSGPDTNPLQPFRPKRISHLARVAVDVGFPALLRIGLTSCATQTSGANLVEICQAAAVQKEQSATMSANSMFALKNVGKFNDGYNKSSTMPIRKLSWLITSVRDHVAQYGRWLDMPNSLILRLDEPAVYNDVDSLDL